MTDDRLRKTGERMLSRLWSFQDQSPGEWDDEELSAILNHQLQASVDDLNDFTDVDVDDVRSSCQPPIDGFGELFEHPEPPMDWLVAAKDFARASDENHGGVLPSAVAKALYLLCIAAAVVRHDQKITSLDQQTLRDRFSQLNAESWLPDRLKPLLQSAARLL